MKVKALMLLIGIIAFSLVAMSGNDSGNMAIFGINLSRNMVSMEKNIPTKWNVETGENIKWVANLGSQTYAGPVILDGNVYVGTNNEARHNPKLQGDRGNVLVFDVKDGKLLWQAAHPKLGAGPVNDWPLQGVCSTPTVQGNRLYYTSNRCTVVSLDTEGFRDGENDGPETDEENTGELDADFIWEYDLMGELDVHPHNMTASSPLVVDDFVYIVTGNGVDEGHVSLPSPFAPSFICLNKNTGELVWESNAPGENVLHGQWGNPSYSVIDGKPQVFFPGGDGWLYSFEPKTGEIIWKFNCNPPGTVWELGGSGTKNNLIACPVVYDNKVFIAMGQDPEHGEGPGHLYAIDATMTGDVTGKAQVWHLGDKDFNRTISTVAIHDGLLYAADLSGFVYCIDVKTGKKYWTYDTFAAIWGSPIFIDGKIYIGDEDGDVAVLQAGKEMKLLHETNMGSAVYTTPNAKDGVLYVASRTKLYAISAK
ncbi:MAG: PQQ-binding-like beta-propeller repeat protein [bacterium]